MQSGVSHVIVGDASVLLSAVAGRAARRVRLAEIEIHTTEFTWNEVQHYFWKFVERFRIPEDVAYRSLRTAPVLVMQPKFYADQMPRARQYMLDRDPKDVDLAALAFKLSAPVWSNDNHFKNFPTKRYTTAQLIKILGV